MHLWVCSDLLFLSSYIFFYAFQFFYMFLVFDTISLFCTNRALLQLTSMFLLVQRDVAHGGAGPSGTTGE